MMLKGVLTLQIVALLMMASLASIPLSEAKIEYVEKDFDVQILPDSTGGGFEPHILAGPGIDGTQWYYVDSPTGLGNTQGGNLWISKDHGETWTWYDKDSVFGTSGDSYTVISKDGAIYYTDLYLSSASVDSSVDGGETWIANPFASVYTIVDRQWLQMGPNSAGEENVYFSFNQLAVGLVMVKAQSTGTTGVALDWIPCNFGLPISSNVGSRDNFVVDQDNGNLYHANYQSNGVYCYISTNEGNSFTGVKVFDETVHAKVQNTFMDIDVDSAGNVYMMWSSREHIMLGVSQDEGSTWDVKQVTETNGTRVLPWIAAGDEGRIAMAWYDTIDTGNPNNLDDSVWDFVVALSLNALDDDPLYEYIVVDPAAHVGSVRTSGLDGDEGPAPDRDLGDFIGIDIDEFGRAIVVFGRDGDDGPNNREIPCLFGRQNEGPFLLEGFGPVANFSVSTSGKEVTVDGSLSEDLGGKEIVNYEWDMGDNTSYSNVTSVTHTYSGDGEYTITLIVTNEDGLMMRKVMTVSVEEKDSFPAALAGSIGAIVILLIIGSVLFIHRKGRGEEYERKAGILKTGSIEWEMPEEEDGEEGDIEEEGADEEPDVEDG